MLGQAPGDVVIGEAVIADPQYTLGWQHGFAAAIGPEPRITPEPTRTHKWLALGTFLAALGGAAVLAVYQTPNHPLRQVATVVGAAGILLAGTVAALRVLEGEPTPKLGIKV